MSRSPELDQDVEEKEIPIVDPKLTVSTVSQKIAAIPLGPIKKGWVFGFAIAFLLLNVLLFSLTVLFIKGVGIWGIRIPIGWGFAIINFVWWIGIGHAGTFISAFLVLLRQNWRTSINRFAESMTLFAVASAGIFPLIHVGRPIFAYWLFPYPSTLGLWPQFRSPLIWDVFAVSTYATVSFLFWFVGLIPDLAAMRDHAKNKWVRYLYGILSLGWRGDALHWYRYDTIYILLAGLATPLVISVHTIVSLDFAVSVVPGWYATIFPPYFVAGAIFSGFAMVLTLLIPIRKFYGLEGMITNKHLSIMSKVMLTSGLIVAYGYMMEIFNAWYSGSMYERYVVLYRVMGDYSPCLWGMIMCNVVLPQMLWSRRVRSNPAILFVLSILINIGMWFERFVIVVTPLARDYMPAVWDIYTPTIWDVLTYLGSLGLFFTLLLGFIRTLPLIAMSEMQHLIHKEEHSRHS